MKETTQTKSDHIVVKRLLKEAKLLHRAARSESIAKSLPVLRRLLLSKTIRDITLKKLHRQTEMIQRKHILHMLAQESGYKSWADYRKAIENNHSKGSDHYSIVLKDSGYPNLWFSTLADAENYVVKHGGQALAVGQQAVVIAEKNETLG